MIIETFRKGTKSAVLPLILSVVLCLPVFSGFAVSAQDSGTNDIKVHINTDGLESPPDITASAAILLNSETGSIVYEKNIQKVVFPAATVKIMTAVLVLENVEDTAVNTIISKYVVDNTTGNSLNPRMSEGEVFTVEDLLNAMLVSGSNDAALALAEYVSGSVPDFVAKMNEKAAELGCVNTTFTNPTGMHSELMHTTASDMAKIALYASKIQKFMDITSSLNYTIPPTNKDREPRNLTNRNHFISKAQPQYYYSYAKGINYGYTAEAGYCLTTVAEQAGLSYLCIVMGASSTPVPDSDAEKINCFTDANSLLEWVFSIYSYKTLVSTSDKSRSAEIRLAANRDNITLVPDTDILVLLPQNVDMEREITTDCEIFEDRLVAPVKKGQELGKLTVFYNGEIVGTANLLSNADVEISNVLYVLDQIKNIVSGIWFKASVIIFIVIFTFYIIVTLMKRGRKEQRRFY